MDYRNSPYGPRDSFNSRSPDDYTQDYGSGRDYSYSSAREYAAAGELGHGRNRDYRDDWNRNRPGPRGTYGADRQRGYGGDRGYDRGRDDAQDRGFFERAGDEVRSWFGDEEAERRRERDQRYDERTARNDDHYTSWRRDRIAELDRDYGEYRRENAQRFHNEFNSWRTERTGQRDSLSRVAEHMEVLGSDGAHVGTVDKVRGDRIILSKSDSDAGGHHHSIPSRWIASVDDKVTLRKSAGEAQAHWKDEERGALFGDEQEDRSWRTDRNLNRSFSGTY